MAATLCVKATACETRQQLFMYVFMISFCRIEVEANSGHVCLGRDNSYLL